MASNRIHVLARVLVAVLVAGLAAAPVTPVRAAAATVGNGISTTDLAAVGMTADMLAADLAGPGVTVSNVTYTGAAAQAGRIHLVDPAVVSFNDGIILSSGNIADVAGPNKSEGTTGDMAGASDPDLDLLIKDSQTVNPVTFDAVSLEFDFVPSASQVYFTYVFGSDEYLEWVNLFNDVFAFYVNGTNCAVTPVGQPVSIDTINSSVNASLYRDNSFWSPPASPINIESDGLSVEMICSATVNPGVTNHMKLALADTSDQILDSVVMIKASSLSTMKPESCNDSVDNDDDTLVDMEDPSCSTSVTPPPVGSSGIGDAGSAPAFTGNEGTPILLDGSVLGWEASADSTSVAWTVTGINGTPGTCEVTPASSPATPPTLPTATAICPNEGEYVARVEGFDVEGGSAFDKDVDFFVHNAPPAVSIDTPAMSTSLEAGASVDLAATVTDPGAADAVSCSIDWGDGAVEAGVLVGDQCTGSHTYPDTGDALVIVTATDDAADTSAAVSLVSIGPAGLTPQTIGWTTTAPIAAAYGDEFTVAATGGGSGNELVYSATGGCANVGDLYTMISSTEACSVSVDQAGDGITYADAPTLSDTVTATLRPIEVTADPATKTEGDADPAFSWQITGGSLVGADALTGALTRDPGETAGAYAITIGTLEAPADYDLVLVEGEFTIDPAPPLDTTPPRATAPVAAMRTSAALSGTAIPVRLTFSGHDETLLDHFDVAVSRDGGTTWGPSTAVAASPYNTTVATSGTSRFRIRALDGAGNPSAWMVGATLAPRLVQQTATGTSYSGAWTLGVSASFSGGSAKYGTRAGASMTYRTTARTIALVTTRGPKRGKVKVYVNGVYTATVDLYRATTQYRAVVWSKSWATSDTRTIKLVVVGTAGRPRVDIDGFAVLR